MVRNVVQEDQFGSERDSLSPRVKEERLMLRRPVWRLTETKLELLEALKCNSGNRDGAI